MKAEKLEGKVALVTGGNSGIGLATAKLFREHGAKVIVTARSEETFKKASAELGSDFDVIQADVSKLSDLDRLYQQIKAKHGHLDVLFANAGVAQFRPTTDSDPEFFDVQFNTNVRGLYYTVSKALPLLRDGSSVILTSSIANTLGLPGASVYAATKAAVRSFARTWTAEISPQKVRFNVVCPGLVDTPVYSKLDLPKEHIEGFKKQMLAMIPAARSADAKEMATVALFLASSDSSYVCGAEIIADGGRTQL